MIMDWLDYREKLGIGFNDEEKEKYFFTKIFNILDDIKPKMQYEVTDEEYFNFCNMTGTSMHHGNMYGDQYTYILEAIDRNSKNIKDFIAYYIAFLNCYEDDSDELTKRFFKNLLCKSLDESHIPYELLEDNGSYFVFPKGAEEFDDALVSEPLEWLEDYPNTHKTFVIALKQYSEGVYIRDVADNLRKALETFLQEFLGNTKNLESNKNEICKYLGDKGVDAGISGLFQPLINAYKNINDRIAKHNDAVDEKLLEFLLYQTGVLIRMVLSVKGVN